MGVAGYGQASGLDMERAPAMDRLWTGTVVTDTRLWTGTVVTNTTFGLLLDRSWNSGIAGEFYAGHSVIAFSNSTVCNQSFGDDRHQFSDAWRAI